MMIVSDTLEYGDTFLALQAAAEQLGREVNPTIYTRKELAKRVKAEELSPHECCRNPRSG